MRMQRLPCTKMHAAEENCSGDQYNFWFSYNDLVNMRLTEAEIACLAEAGKPGAKISVVLNALAGMAEAVERINDERTGQSDE